MKVVTLNQPRFNAACVELWNQAVSRVRPDILIGIRTGGFVVAQAITDGADLSNVGVLPITKRRASTAAKSGNPWVGRILRRLPYAVTDRIRSVEHHLLTRPGKPAKPASIWEPDPTEAAALVDELRRRPASRVLIVDDAVDTGATLKAVVAFVAASAPQASVTTAALVVTAADPVIRPDIVLYREILCRFPWSHDFHG